MLNKLNPQLVETRRGAWDALLSPGADKETQSMSSSRKLLLDTLKLAGKGKKPEDRIRSILGGLQVGVMEANVQFLISIYDAQSDAVHGTMDFDTAFGSQINRVRTLLLVEESGDRERGRHKRGSYCLRLEIVCDQSAQDFRPCIETHVR